MRSENQPIIDGQMIKLIKEREKENKKKGEASGRQRKRERGSGGERENPQPPPRETGQVNTETGGGKRTTGG